MHLKSTDFLSESLKINHQIAKTWSATTSLDLFGIVSAYLWASHLCWENFSKCSWVMNLHTKKLKFLGVGVVTTA